MYEKFVIFYEKLDDIIYNGLGVVDIAVQNFLKNKYLKKQINIFNIFLLFLLYKAFLSIIILEIIFYKKFNYDKN